jgi:Ser/Thr protein kinase RdoA (MazF antagonist)
MNSYDKLTRLGKIRRLRQVALKALEQYELRVKWVKFLSIETNTMFQIRSEDNDRYVLRIYSDEETTLRENQTEMFWLNALKRDTDIKVTEPIARRDGECITVVCVPGVPGRRRCALFKWIPGRPLENHICAENYYKYGQTSAKLHNHASTLKPLPPNIRPKKWDKVFYYPDEPVVYNAPEYSHLFTPERIELLESVIEQANEVFQRLFADIDGQILIHGDLHYWNVHFHRGELYVIDFEDINLGYPVQDLAVTLYYGRQREGYSEWKAAFKQGYCSLRKWPVESEMTIETLMAARSVMLINYVARVDSSPEEYFNERGEDLAHFQNLSG